MRWQQCKNILCIRADNMGDVLMTSPAFRALKETFDYRLTMLTSKMGGMITPHIKEIDETIVFDLPWVKTNIHADAKESFQLIEKLKTYSFDAAIIFTVYSQSALPSAMLAYMSGIPLRLAYCRENPYHLLTDWIPDEEPYKFIQHQVKRDLNLVKFVGAETNNEHLSVQFKESAFANAIEKLNAAGFNQNKKYLTAHVGVSEKKREYPAEHWIEMLHIIRQQTGMQVLITGANNEKQLTQHIQDAVGENIFSAAGILNIEEFIAVVAHSQLVVTVNTATVHIAAALNKPVIVLYALTNPQHTPWLTKNIVMPYSVPSSLKSKNEVIDFVNLSYFEEHVDFPSPVSVAENVMTMLNESSKNISNKFIFSN